ncbi:condensation domain-containing protein [Kitasatospora sp. NPDC059160]|uniref:condensation domain-containing protein n=1 Tax=Kitasatospora sp. NPDC059160 TaxID=3346748 RepID=UPI0036A74123
MTAHHAAPRAADPHETDPHQTDPHDADPHDADPYEAAPHGPARAHRRITVRFAATTGGSGPLTRGQDNMIRCIRRDAPEAINKESVWPVPPGASLAAGLDALRLLVERHESLRTSFPPGPGPDAFPVSQVVRGDGRFAVTAVEAGGLDVRELDALAAELGQADVAVPVPLDIVPRIRFTLLVDGQRLLRLIAVVCHAGADGAATALLIQDWYALAAGKELPPVSAPTPIQIAAAEQSPQGRRRAAGALRHWARVLGSGPQVVFADSRITGPPSGPAALMVRSRTAAADLAAVCRRTGASPSVVLLAAFSALVAHRAGRAELAVSALSANRQRAALLDHVGTLAQDALILLDTGTADLDQLIGRTKSASLSAYWHSVLDAEQVWQLVEDAAHVRGSRFARQVVVNDLSLTIPAAVADAQPAATADPELTPLPAPPLPVRLMFTILRIAGSLDFALISCPQVLDPEETERFARALLDLLAKAAVGPVPLAELHAAPGPPAAAAGADASGGDWQLVDGARIDLAAVRGLVGAALDTALDTGLDTGPDTGPGGGPDPAPAFRPDCRVTVEDGRLTVDLTTADPHLTPADVHRAVVAALPGRDTAMAPQHYRIHHLGPDGERLASGSGRDLEVVARFSALT